MEAVQRCSIESYELPATRKRKRAIKGNVKRRRLRRPKRSIVQMAGRANVVLTRLSHELFEEKP